MDTTMKIGNPYQKETAFRRWWNTRTFIQKRLIRLCLSMLMMAICFPLYYLGLFGTVEGPLNPSRIGDLLAIMGATRNHIIGTLLVVAVIAGTWNWIYNLVSRQIGARLSCKRQVDDEGQVCGAAVRRTFTVNRKTGQSVARYVCRHGHKRRDADFHAVTKGHASHVIWVIALAFIAIVLFR